MIDSFENAPELIRVEDLHKSFGGVTVLDKKRLQEIARGE